MTHGFCEIKYSSRKTFKSLTDSHFVPIKDKYKVSLYEKTPGNPPASEVLISYCSQEVKQKDNSLNAEIG